MSMNLKDYISDFVNHVNSMTDEEVLASINKAHQLVASEYDAESVRHGCEYCSGDNAEYQNTSYVKLSINTVLGDKVLVAECNPCPPYANCCMKGAIARSAFRINYCPNCGARLNGGQNGKTD